MVDNVIRQDIFGTFLNRLNFLGTTMKRALGHGCWKCICKVYQMLQSNCILNLMVVSTWCSTRMWFCVSSEDGRDTAHLLVGHQPGRWGAGRSQKSVKFSQLLQIFWVKYTPMWNIIVWRKTQARWLLPKWLRS